MSWEPRTLQAWPHLPYPPSWGHFLSSSHSPLPVRYSITWLYSVTLPRMNTDPPQATLQAANAPPPGRVGPSSQEPPVRRRLEVGVPHPPMMKTPTPCTDTEVAPNLGWGRSGTRWSGCHLPASSTRQVDRGLSVASLPPQVATRPESVVKVAWRDLGLGREGGGQPGEEGTTELEFSLALL